ncbi:MAG: four helix bundle protein [Candidatus Marinimicrobia bacterium]|nr:four helix bundle protein [Candidatus Neomarinimicrobiota bacterium]MCH7762178.1 four helix bundle protein [Candidatus Neomarinimicrobiota bacterium]
MAKGGDMKDRTWKFALRCIKLCKSLPNTYEGRHFGGQLLRSSTSVAANYRASQLSQSKKTFIAKLSIALEESDESALWMEFIIADNLLEEEKVKPLLDEANEITNILAKSRITARKNKK